MDNILHDMDEVGDWASIADCLGANDINSHFATRDDVMVICDAVLRDDRVYFGTIFPRPPGGGLTPLPDKTTAEGLARRIFDEADDTISGMMEFFVDWVDRGSA
ncbi:MAG: hypothetical protein ACTH1D_10015 [Mycobacteriaceae bacterium]|uniref:hypothetical protein n=1 Tax=Corynebacterium sp. TaxID=1720 RepID=UPI003F949F24